MTNRVKQFLCFLLLFLCPYNASGEPEFKEHNYNRAIHLLKPMTRGFFMEITRPIAGIDLSYYGYKRVYQYVIESQTYNLFVLGLTEEKQVLLGAVNLVDRTFRVIAQFSADETQYLLQHKPLGFAVCFLNHHFSRERLRYVFLMHTLPPLENRKKGETFLQVFRQENDEALAFTRVASTKVGEVDVDYDTPFDSPYIYVRRSNDFSAKPAVYTIPRLLLADVNHDEFMDIVIWRKVYVARPRDAEASPAEKKELEGFTLNREEIQVMFFDWERIAFSEPVTMSTQSLGGDLLWRVLFPSNWEQRFEAWRESPMESPEQ